MMGWTVELTKQMGVNWDDPSPSVSSIGTSCLQNNIGYNAKHDTPLNDACMYLLLNAYNLATILD